MPAKLPKVPKVAKVKDSAPKAKGQLGSYTSTENGNRRSYIWLSPAQDQRRDLTPSKRAEMVKKMRWGERNSGFVRQMVSDLVLYTVGDGFRPQAHSTDPEWNKAAEAYFAEWGRKCDITGRFSFGDILRIAERRWVLDGDFFLAKVRNGTGAAKLQGIEAHRVGDPSTEEGPVPARMHDGVLFGAYGEIVGFNIYRSDGTSRVILANAMMQVCDPEYVSGARGLPLLQHSWNDIQDSMEMMALEKTAVKDHAEIVRVLKRAGGEFGPDLASELQSNPNAAVALGQGLGGKFVALEPGEDIDLKASNRPNSNFDPFIRMTKSDASYGVMPLDFIDPTQINGAAVRLTVAKVDRIANRHQQLLIESVCLPTWGYVIGDAIARGDLPDVDGWEKVSWTTPKRVTVDAGREAANDRADVEMGLLSMSELYSQRGMDFREEMEKRAADMAFIRDTAAKAGIPFELLYRMSNAQPGTIAAAPTSNPTP
jgi:capsid protein